MPIKLSDMQATLDALTAEVARTEGTEESAGKLIAGFSAAIADAVTKALTENDAANQTSIDAATKAIADVTARFAAADDKLGAADRIVVEKQ